MRTREEHLEWAKKRAMEYLDQGDLQNAVVSMGSDLSKHPETTIHSGTLLQLAITYVVNQDADGVRRWIEGFR